MAHLRQCSILRLSQIPLDHAQSAPDPVEQFISRLYVCLQLALAGFSGRRKNQLGYLDDKTYLLAIHGVEPLLHRMQCPAQLAFFHHAPLLGLFQIADPHQQLAVSQTCALTATYPVPLVPLFS